MKIALTGGGTAGHVTPHLALLPELKQHFNDIIYLGSENGIEREIISKYNIRYFSTTTTKLIRKNIFKNLSIPFKLLKGIKEAKKILKSEKPNIIFSKGGFVSLPAVIAGHKLGIPIIIHESDLTMGLANKIASKYADIVCTTFEETAKKIKDKGLYTGSPIRKTDSSFTNPFNNHKPILTITGGSQGAKTINTAVRNNLDNLLNQYNIIHIVGKGNLENINRKGYKQIEFTDDILSIFRNSHIVVSRSGSNTIFELLKLGIPMILIPLPKGNSRGDQIDNAKYFESKGYAKILLQENLTNESLIKIINEMEEDIKDIQKSLKMALIPNSVNLIIDKICTLANKND